MLVIPLQVVSHGERVLCLVPVAKRYFVPPPADCNLPPLSGAGSLRSPKLPFYSKLRFQLIINFVNFYLERSIPKKK